MRKKHTISKKCLDCRLRNMKFLHYSSNIILFTVDRLFEVVQFQDQRRN